MYIQKRLWKIQKLLKKTLIILLSAWDRSRDSTAKINLSKDVHVEDLKQNYLTNSPNPTAGGINPSRISPTHIPRIISDMPGKIFIKYFIILRINSNLDNTYKHFPQNQKQHNSAKIINRADKNSANLKSTQYKKLVPNALRFTY